MKPTVLAAALAALLPLSAPAAPSRCEAVMIDALTNLEMPGSEARVHRGRFKVEIPNVPFDEYRLCIPLGLGGLDLGTAQPDDRGELRMEGELPSGDYPLQLTVHAALGACGSAPAYFSAAGALDPEDETEEDEVEEVEVE